MAYKLNLYRNGVFERILVDNASSDEVDEVITSFEEENGLNLEKVERPRPSKYPTTIEVHDLELGCPIGWLHFIKAAGAG